MHRGVEITKELKSKTGPKLKDFRDHLLAEVRGYWCWWYCMVLVLVVLHGAAWCCCRLRERSVDEGSLLCQLGDGSL